MSDTPTPAPEESAAHVSQPAPVAQPAPEPQPQQPARPLYGEYATPEQLEASHPEAAAIARAALTESTPTADPGASAAAASTPAPTSGRVEGVPHNLGVGGAPQQPAAPAAHTPPPTQAPQAPQAPQNTPATGGSTPQTPVTPATPPVAQFGEQQSYVAAPPTGQRPTAGPTGQQSGGKTADRIITILLLGIGAIFALGFANSMMTMRQMLSIYGDILGVEPVSIPASVGTLGTIGGILMLSIFAVTLIMSIQRMRRRKLAFFIPLIAGVLAFIIAIIIMTIGLMSSPELMQAFTDPDALTKVLEAAQTGNL